MPSENPESSAEWQALARHRQAIGGIHMRDLFAADPERFKSFHIAHLDLLLDYSKNAVMEETMRLLGALARARGVESWRERLFAGEKINATESRAALHTALRDPNPKDRDVSAYVRETLRRVRDISNSIRNSPAFTDIVHIGIGGADLGVRMVCTALGMPSHPRLHFVSNMDGADLGTTLREIDARTTLFIVTSKTFTTQETLTNAASAKAWLEANMGGAWAERMIAVTANVKGAAQFGVKPDNILPLREWIGGRYSLWSAAGLPIAIAVGYAGFERLLRGAHAMDRHFMEAPLEKNMPAVLALIGLWHRNFCGYAAQAVLPYSWALRRLPAYIQQLDMESNGKNTTRAGGPVSWSTSPAVFGAPGTDAQHAFFQCLHQGTDIIPCDFIAAVEPPLNGLPGHHEALLANLLAQSRALMEGHGGEGPPYMRFAGNRPSNTILLPRLDAHALGMLLALYEHKVFVQGILWGINSFDQWGVELGKQFAGEIRPLLDMAKPRDALDSSTAGLLGHIRKNNM